MDINIEVVDANNITLVVTPTPTQTITIDRGIAGPVGPIGPAGSVASVSVVSANGLAGTVANPTTTPAITLSTTVTGIAKGNGTALSAAVAGTDYIVPPSGTALLKANSGGALANAISGTDYAPATSGSSILYGNSAGGFSNVSIGSGLTFATGTLSSTDVGGTVTSVGGTGTVNGITLTGTVTSSGNLTLGGTLSSVSLTSQISGTLPIANGGTNAITAAAALTNLSAAGTAIANTFTDSQVVQAATAANEVVRVRGIDTNTSALAVQRYSADANPAEINLYKSRGATVGSDARVQTNDVTGSVNFYACGSSAGSYQIIAAIRAQDGTTTVDNDLPGSLRFFTRTDSSSGTLTQKMTLGSGGTLSVLSDISTSSGGVTAAGQISGSYYFATPPSQVVLAITQNALYAAPTSGFAPGDVIYTQDAYYAVTQAGSPGYIPTYQSVYLAADFTLSAASGVQACLTAVNDTLTIAAATTYEFEGQYILNTGATTHTTAMAFLLAGGATVSSFEYTTILWSAAANTISTAASFTHVSGVASKVLNATSTAVYTTIKFKGVMRTTLGGTITPQIAFSANPTGTNLMKKGSFVKFTPIGSDTVEPIGLWA